MVKRGSNYLKNKDLIPFSLTFIPTFFIILIYILSSFFPNQKKSRSKIHTNGEEKKEEK